MTEAKPVTVIGAGLAGSEAAWQLAVRGVPVRLYEMKPEKMSPAHHSGDFAELVCSNSLRGAALETAPGLLKEELRRLGSLIIACADETKVEAGGALAVDREAFSALVTKKLTSHANIEIIRSEVREIPKEGLVIVATGPLTDEPFASAIKEFLSGDYLSFYDAAAPLIDFDSIDMDKAFFASRYGKGTPDYINCPLERDEYLNFVHELANAEEAEIHGFEDRKVFEGCMPVEVMARRGEDTLRHGPLKPIGIRHPETGESYYAVVQLRKDNAAGSVYNMVGFQTHLKFGEQKRVFSMIPALRKAVFLRYGVMHRNSYINSPQLLGRFYEVRHEPRVSFAGQITGVEGYIESAASGLYTAVHMARKAKGMEPAVLPGETAIGALASYVSGANSENFQPMNINFGLLPKIEKKISGKRERYRALAQRALDIIDEVSKEFMK